MTREEYNKATSQNVDEATWAGVAAVFNDESIADEAKAAIPAAVLPIVANLCDEIEQYRRWWQNEMGRSAECEDALFLKDEDQRMDVAVKQHTTNWLIAKKAKHGVGLSDEEYGILYKALSR